MGIYRRKRFHPRVLLAVLVLASMATIALGLAPATAPVVGLLKTQAQQAIIPFQSFTNTTAKGVGNFFGGVFEYKSLKAQNIRLQDRVRSLQNEIISGQNTKRELSSLLAQLRLPFAANISKVVGQVVARSTTNFSQTIEINKGSSSGLKTGMPVVGSGGLIGRLVQVSASRSVVVLIQDPTSYVGVRFAKNGVVGLAQGGGYNHLLSIQYIGTNVKVSPGSLVVTSGLQNSVFPPDIPVGKVVSAKTNPAALSQNIKVKPLVNADTLEFVSVLRWK